MFLFVVRYLGFLKTLPLLAQFFDSWLKLYMLVIKPDVLDWVDELESDVLQWKGVTLTLHKYGGSQLNYQEKEIGHVHSNGIVDILFSKTIKQRLLKDGKINNHHLFAKSGWISFPMEKKEDKAYAVELLKTAYEIRTADTKEDLTKPVNFLSLLKEV